MYVRVTASLMLYEYGKPGSHFPVRRKQWEGVSRPLVMNQYTALLRKNISLVQPSVPIKQKKGKGEREGKKTTRLCRNQEFPYCKIMVPCEDRWHSTGREKLTVWKFFLYLQKGNGNPTCRTLIFRVMFTVSALVEKKVISSSFLIWKFLLINTCKLHHTEVWC